jgi:surface polysaccharide O-acyltransferase-like enzyme
MAMSEKPVDRCSWKTPADPQYLSEKLRIFSLLLMVMVVYIHAYNLNVRFDDNVGPVAKASSGRIFSWSAFLQEFLSDGICRIAVPYFFMISAYFLFQKYAPAFSFANYVEAVKKRIKTLVVPFLIVSAGGLILVVVLQKIPGTGVFFQAYKLENFTLKLLLFKLFVLPVSYQLWFINYLFRCVLLAPIIYFMIKYFGVFYLYGLLILWVDYNLQFKSDIPQIQAETLFSFSIGAWLAIKQISIPRITSSRLAIVLIVAWVGLTLFRTSYKFQTMSFAEVHYWLKPAVFLGVLAMWSAYDVWFSHLSKSKFWLSVASFNIGIYLFHEPTLTIFKKLAIRFAGSAEMTLLLVYLFTGLAAILFSYWISKCWKRYFPQSYAVVTGGR